jgi:hypothetical protein
MDNQHRQIKGYRELSQKEIDAMNECKSAGVDLGELIEKINAIPEADKRCIAIARTEFQTGLMWLIRAIARPEGFG